MKMGDKEAISDLLRTVTNLPIHNYSSYGFGRQQNRNCVSVIIPPQSFDLYLPAVREQLPNGYVAFIGINWGVCWWIAKTEERTGYELVVGLGNTQFDILKLARPDRLNDSDINRLKKYNDNFGIDIFRVTDDEIEFRLLSKPADLKAFGQDLIDYCPDILNNFFDTDNPELELQRLLETTGIVSLWWD